MYFMHNEHTPLIFGRNLATDWDINFLVLQELSNFLPIALSSARTHSLIFHPATEIKLTDTQIFAYLKIKEYLQNYLLHIFTKQ